MTNGTGGVGSSVGAAVPIYEWRLNGDDKNGLEAAPAAMQMLAEPACALAEARIGPTGVAVLVRPAQIDERPMLLLAVYDASVGNLQARALAFDALDVAAEGPRFFQRIPALLEIGPESGAPTPHDVAAARAVLAGLLRPTPGAGRPGLNAPRNAAFWPRLAALAALLPAALRPMLSAAAGVEGDAAALLHADDGAIDLLPYDFSGVDHMAALNDGPASTNAILARWPSDPTDAPAALIDSLRAIAAQSGVAAAHAPELEQFLWGVDAPPPEPTDDASERALQLARTAAAAEDAASMRPDCAAPDGVGGADLPVFGCARAAGLLAIEAEGADSAIAWRLLAQHAPSRAYWAATALADPGLDGEDVEQTALRSFAQLSKIFALDHKLRAALPDGAPTPLEAPRFQRLALEFLNRQAAAHSLSAHPHILLGTDGSAAAPWLARLMDLWGQAGVKSKNMLIATLEAVEDAAKITGLATRFDNALRLTRAHALKDQRVEKNPRSIDQLCFDFARRMSRALQERSPRGALFWRRAAVLLLDKQRREAPNDYAQIEALMLKRFDGDLDKDAAVRRLLQAQPDAPAAPPRATPVEPTPAPQAAVSPPPPQAAGTLEETKFETPKPTEDAPTAPKAMDSLGTPPAPPAETPQPAPATAEDAEDPDEEVTAPAPVAVESSAALATARVAVARWRARYLEIVHDRSEGGVRQKLAFSAPGNEEMDAAALEALSLCAATSLHGDRDPFDDAVGADIAWTARQLLDLRNGWKDRAIHAPAPEIVTQAWRTLAYSDPGADLQGDELFFLFFASKLLQRAERGGYQADPLTETFLKVLEDNSKSFMAGGAQRVTVSPSKGYLRDYVYLSRSGETAKDFEKLSDEEIQTRLDRILFFLSLIHCQTIEERQPQPEDLWDPTFRDPKKQGRSLDAPPVIRERMEKFFKTSAPTNLAYAHAFETITSRNNLYALEDISHLNRLTGRIRRASKGAPSG